MTQVLAWPRECETCGQVIQSPEDKIAHDDTVHNLAAPPAHVISLARPPWDRPYLLGIREQLALCSKAELSRLRHVLIARKNELNSKEIAEIDLTIKLVDQLSQVNPLMVGKEGVAHGR